MQGLLQAHSSVASHTLLELSQNAASSQPAAAGAETADLPVLLLIDTAGCGCEEQQEEEGDSRRNEREAQVIMTHVERLLGAGVPATDIGIITPYSAQVGVGVLRCVVHNCFEWTVKDNEVCVFIHVGKHFVEGWHLLDRMSSQRGSMTEAKALLTWAVWNMCNN